MNAPNLPAYLQNRTSNRGLAQALVANLGIGSPPYLSIMGNRLTLIDAVGEEIAVPTYDPKTGPYIDVCIVDVLEHTSKIWYNKPFDPGANQYEPPACFSDNGIAPSRNSAKPQSRTCAECQWAAWGSKVSAVSGKGVKACGDVQKIAFTYAGFEMPFLLRVPPNSRTNFRGYVNKFIGQQMDLCDVLTRISFEQGTLGTLLFGAVGWLDDATVALRDKLVAGKAMDGMIGRTDLPIQAALAPPATQQALPAVEPQQVQQPAPFVPSSVPSADFPLTQAAPQSTQTAAPAPAASPSEPQRRRRRTAAEMAAAGAVTAPQQNVAQPAQAQQAPFMQAPAGGPAPSFGIQAGAAPNPELMNTLDSLFGKK